MELHPSQARRRAVLARRHQVGVFAVGSTAPPAVWQAGVADNKVDLPAPLRPRMAKPFAHRQREIEPVRPCVHRC